MKKRTNKNKQKNKLFTILDSNYFCVCITQIDNKETWKIYYKNLPTRVYYSSSNKPLLTSEKNTIENIYALKEKFEKEKQKEFQQHLSEYLSLDKEVFYQTLSIKRIGSTMLTDIQLLYLVASVINLFFVNHLFWRRFRNEIRTK